MAQEYIAVVLEQAQLSVEELGISCGVSDDWVIEHVQAGVLLSNPGPDITSWRFSGQDMQRVQKICELERDFDAVPELAGLVVDLLEETRRLRARLRREGLSPD